MDMTKFEDQKDKTNQGEYQWRKSEALKKVKKKKLKEAACWLRKII